MEEGVPPAGRFGGKKRKQVYGAISFLLLLIIAAAIWVKFDNAGSPVPTIDINDKKAVSRHLATSYLNYAEQEVGNRNYDQAVRFFVLAANKAIEVNKYPLAKSILMQCMQTVPDPDIPAHVHYELATVAKEQKDTVLEEDNLKKALAKADQTDSGVSSYQVENITKRLEELR